jgi:Kef-type K+ transport system membrane component KefB
MGHDIINDMAICIVMAWLLALAAQVLRQPLILAYLIAGFVVGPIGAGFVQEKKSIEDISGLGLILLLFMIGLEIDLKKVVSVGRIITLTGVAQILGGCGGDSFFGRLAFLGRDPDVPPRSGAALSSTVITVKILYDNANSTLAGRVTLGVLVLQDLFAVLSRRSSRT